MREGGEGEREGKRDGQREGAEGRESFRVCAPVPRVKIYVMCIFLFVCARACVLYSSASQPHKGLYAGARSHA